MENNQYNIKVSARIGEEWHTFFFPFASENEAPIIIDCGTISGPTVSFLEEAHKQIKKVRQLLELGKFDEFDVELEWYDSNSYT